MHHVLEVVVAGDGDQGVEVLSGELVLEGNVSVAAESGELGDHEIKLDATVDGEDLGLPAVVGELVVVRSGEDLASIAAHELGLVVLRWLLGLIVPGRRVLELYLSGTWRGVTGIRIRGKGIVFHLWRFTVGSTDTASRNERTLCLVRGRGRERSGGSMTMDSGEIFLVFCFGGEERRLEVIWDLCAIGGFWDRWCRSEGG